MGLRWEILAGYGPLFVSGLWMTIQLTLIALTAGLALGVVLGLVSSSHDAPQPSHPLLAWGLRLTRGITLYPGDIIATGTPSGVGMGFSPPKWLKHGDVVRIEIDGVGAIENRFEER